MAINSNNLEPEFEALLKAHVQQRADNMVCHQFNPDDATAYLERAMGNAALAQFEAHLASCSVCRRHLIELSRLMPSPTIVAEPMPAPFSFKDRLSEWFSGRRLGLMAGMGAVAATVLLVVVVLNRTVTDDTSTLVAVRQAEVKTAPLPEATLQNAPATKPIPSASPELDKKLSDEIGTVKGISGRSVSPAISAPSVGESGAPPPPPPPVPNSVEAERKEVTASQAPAAAGAISQNQIQTLRGQAPSGPEANQFQAERALETRKREAQTPTAQSADSVASTPSKPAAKAIEPPAERIVEKSKKDAARDEDKKQASAKTDSRPLSSTESGRAAPAGRNIGGKTFRQENGIWVDTTYQPGNNLPVVRLTRDSREFQQTLKDIPGLKPYFDLKPVIVVWQGKVYRVENK